MMNEEIIANSLATKAHETFTGLGMTPMDGDKVELIANLFRIALDELNGNA